MRNMQQERSYWILTSRKKQECDRRISEVQEQIEQSKVEESTKSVVPGTVRSGRAGRKLFEWNAAYGKYGVGVN